MSIWSPLVRDATDTVGAGDRFVLKSLEQARVPVILVLNKIDRVAKTRLLPLIDWYRREREFSAIVPVSALTGDGVAVLEREIIGQLPEGEPLYPDDFLTDQPERVLAAETVREKVLRHTHAELPFRTAVVVDRFDEDTERGILRLYCSILVERASQKADRHWPRWRHGASDRHRGQTGSRAVLRHQGFPGPARQG